MTFDSNVEEVILKAMQIARENKHSVVTTAEVLLALLAVPQTLAKEIFQRAHLDEAAVHQYLAEHYTPGSKAIKGTIELAKEVKEVLAIAKDEAERYQQKEINTGFLLLALLLREHTLAVEALCQQRPLSEWTQGVLGELNIDRMDFIKKHPHQAKNQGTGLAPETTAQETPELDQVSRNLTKLAQAGKIDPVIGREKEIDRVLQILARRTKNNPLILGEPGVGKTAIAEGIALRIAEKEVPLSFQNKQIVQLDIASVVAGTRFRGDFEERMKKIMKEVAAQENIILFIDELHMLMSAGSSEGSVDASNILKPALARGEIQVLGATTFDEYQKHIEKDRAFARRFATVKLSEPSAEATLEILHGLKERYETYHQLVITEEALVAAVQLSERYLADRKFPDKAIDLLDEAAAKLRLQASNYRAYQGEQKCLDQLKVDQLTAFKEGDYKEAKAIYQRLTKQEARLAQLQKAAQQKLRLTRLDISEVVSDWTNIPLQEIAEKEGERLLHLEEELHHSVIGQDAACTAVARAIRRARSGLAAPQRPIGSFLFLGPTGVGKTELAKTLAKAMFGDEKQLIRVDMSEYMSKENVSRLIGSAPGYVGYEEGGQLTEKIRQKPYSVLLLDEVEKAHPDVFNLMLQILDDGFVTDAKGRRVDFTNTIIIMTSNIGANEVRDQKTVGFGANPHLMAAEREKIMKEALKQHFRPEFLNRIDDTIIFNALSEKEIQAIAKLLVQEVSNRLAEMNIHLKVSAAVYEHLAKEGYEEEYGARPLRRLINREVEDRLADALLKGEIKAGDTVQLGVRKGQYYVKKK